MRGLLSFGSGVLLALVGVMPTPAFAGTAPPNDAFAGATQVATFPLAIETVDLASASVEDGEPDAGTCAVGRTTSVWYTFAAPDTGVVVTAASNYAFADLRLTTYSTSGEGFASLTQVGCRGGSGAAITSTVRVTQGTTYYVQVAAGGSGGGLVDIGISFHLPPANDNFADATEVVGSGFHDSVELWAATVETGEPSNCPTTPAMSRTAWYRFVATDDGDLLVDATASSFAAPRLAAYEQRGTGLEGLSIRACGSEGLLVAPVVAGRTYYVQAANSVVTTSSWGTLDIDVEVTIGAPPANDAFANATAVTAFPFDDGANLRFATVEAGEPNPCSLARTRTAWYAITPSSYGAANASVTGFPGAEIVAYSATAPGLGGLVSLACGTAGTVNFAAEPGHTYYLQVSDSGSGWGVAFLHATYVNVPPPPPLATNDDFADATVVAALPFDDLVDIRATTSEPGEPASCGGTGRTVWYAYTALFDGYVSASPQASRFWDPVVTVYRADGPGLGGLTRVGCAMTWSAMTFAVKAGTTYYVQASDTGSGAGAFGLHLGESIAPPANDRLADATVIGQFPFSDSVRIDGAWREYGEPSQCSSTPQHTVWYTLTTPFGGTVTVDPANSTFWDVNLQVYRAADPGFGGLAFVACQFVSPVSFAAQPGATYYVQASEAVSPSGLLRVAFTYTPAPDTVPPEISITGNATPYALDQALAVSATAVDDRDGSVTPTCSLSRDADGEAVTTSCSLGGFAWELGLGGFAYAVSASDAAGNRAEASAHLDVITTYPSMANLVRAWTSKTSVANDLVALLDAAAAAEARGQPKVEANKLGSFRASVRAQSGKAIDAEKAALLVAFSSGL